MESEHLYTDAKGKKVYGVENKITKKEIGQERKGAEAKEYEDSLRLLNTTNDNLVEFPEKGQDGHDQDKK